MTSYLTYLMVEAQESGLAAGAHRAPRPAAVGIRRTAPRRVRIRTAQLLMSIAARLDHRMQPPTARVAPTSART